MKVKALNPQNNQIEEIDDSLVPQYVQQGYSIEDGKEFKIESPDGQRGTIQTADLKKALESNYKLISSQQQKREQLEEKYDNPIYGALTGAARGLTMGLSDQALVKSQLLTPEEMQVIKEQNPISSVVGEVTGFIAPLLATGGASAGAQAVSKIGALPRLTQKAAEIVGKKGLEVVGKKATSKIAQKAIQTGITGVVEGALQGLGQTISEDALGTAEFNAESLLYNVGIGGALGGAIGAGIGGVSEASSRFLSKGTREARKKLVSSLDVPEAEKTSLIKSIEMDDELEDIITKMGQDDVKVKAFKELGIDAPEYLTSQSPIAKTSRDYLSQSHTPAAYQMRAEIDPIREKIDDYTKSLLASNRQVSDTELGEFAKNTIMADIGERVGVAKTYYESLKQFDDLPVSPKIKKLLRTRLDKNDAVRLQLLPKNEIDDILASVDLAQNIGDVTKVRSALRGRVSAAFRSGDYEKANALDDIYQTLTRMREDAVIRSPLPKQLKQDVIKGREIADKKYREVFEEFKPLDKLLGGREAKSIDQMLAKVENLDNGQVYKKFYASGKIEQTTELAQKYPQLYGVIKEKRLNELFNDSFGKFKGETVFSPEKLVKNLSKMKPEEKALLFPNLKIDEVANNIRIASESLPKSINYSNTGEWMSLRQQVVDMALGTFGVKQAADKALYNALKNGDSFVNNYFLKTLPVLDKVEKAGNSLKIAVDNTARDFISNIRRSLTTASISYKQPSEEEVKKAREDYEILRSNPQKIMDEVLNKNKQLYVAAPKAYQVMEQKVGQAVAMIADRMPKTDQNMFGDQRQPSRSELFKIHEYIKGINNPKQVMAEISKGYVNPYALETFKVVYPDSYAKITEAILTRLPQIKLTSEQKRRIEKLLGASSQASTQPQNKMRLQANFQPQQPQQQMAQPAKIKSDVKNMNLAGRSQGGIDTILARRNS